GEYIAKMSELLSENGKYVGLLFNREFEVSPPFGGKKKAYEELFRCYFKSYYMEVCYNSISDRKESELFFIARKSLVSTFTLDTSGLLRPIEQLLVSRSLGYAIFFSVYDSCHVHTII